MRKLYRFILPLFLSFLLFSAFACGQVNSKICSFVLNDGQYLTTSMAQSSKYELLLAGDEVKIMEEGEEIAKMTFLSESTYTKYWNNAENIEGLTFLGKQMGKTQVYLLFQENETEDLSAVFLLRDTDTGVKISGSVSEEEMKQIVDDLTIKVGNKKKV